MIDKPVWSGAIAVVTLIVTGAGALPELLLRPASIGLTVVVPHKAPKVEAIARLEQPAIVAQSASVPAVNRADTIVAPQPSTAPPEQSAVQAAPQSVAMASEPPKPEPEVLAAPVPAPAPVAFPPVQAVGVPAASVTDVIPPVDPLGLPANPARPLANKPARSERTAPQPPKPSQNVRPAAYPIGEFLAWRR
jgi:hypothetical protein